MQDTFSACVTLGRSLGFEEGHSLQDVRLALRLFDQTAELHRLDDESRELLQYAALLHDIGYVEGYERHHKRAYQLIMQAELPGLTDRQKRIVANVARYHRGARPSLDHTGFAALDEEAREQVVRLAAILRLADGLDRSHTDAVRDVETWLEDGALVVKVDCPSGCPDEMWAGDKKGRFLGDVFGLRVELRSGSE